MKQASSPAREPALGAYSGELAVVPKRHIGRWVAASAVVLVLAGFINLLRGARIEWSLIPNFFVSPILLEGLRGTVILTVATMLLGLVLGTLLAVMKLSKNPIVRWTSAVYIWLFRAVPALLQLIIWFNIGLVVEKVHIPLLYEGPTAGLVTPFTAALLGLGLAEAAYMAEIVRSGMLAIDPGQSEAALSLGMTPLKTIRRIVLPQALRVIIPPTGNEVIGMLKYTSVAFAVAYSELLSQSARIYTNNFKVMEVLLAATLWYIILTASLTLVQRWVERRLDLSRPSRRQLSFSPTDEKV